MFPTCPSCGSVLAHEADDPEDHREDELPMMNHMQDAEDHGVQKVDVFTFGVTSEKDQKDDREDRSGCHREALRADSGQDDSEDDGQDNGEDDEDSETESEEGFEGRALCAEDLGCSEESPLPMCG